MRRLIFQMSTFLNGRVLASVLKQLFRAGGQGAASSLGRQLVSRGFSRGSTSRPKRTRRRLRSRKPFSRKRKFGATARPFKRRFKRFRGGGRDKRSARRHLLTTLTVPNNIVHESMDFFLVPATSNVTGKGVFYASGTDVDRGGSNINSNRQTFNPTWLCRIADKITGGGANVTNLNFFITEWVIQYQLTSQSQGFVNVSMYSCVFRKDVPLLAADSFSNVVNLLSDGFLEQGITDGLARDELTPFNSIKFCEYVKILKVKKFLLPPGQQRSFVIKHLGSRRIKPTNFTEGNAGAMATWLTIPLMFCSLKGGRFILFKFTGASALNAADESLTFTTPKVTLYTRQKIQYKYLVDDIESITDSIAPVNIASSVLPQTILPDTDAISAISNA